MSSLLEKYLDAVSHQMRSLPPVIRDGELRETESHLQQLIDDLVSQGQDENAATAEAIKRFGPAPRVGIRLRDVWEGNHSWLAVCGAFVTSNLMLYVAMSYISKMAISFASVVQPQILQLAPIAYIFWAISGLVFCCPVLLNYALGRWAGRRAVPAAVIWCIFISLVSLKSFLGSNAVRGVLPSIFATILFYNAVHVLGAWWGARQIRRRRLALVSGCATQDEAALLLTQLLLRRPNWRRLTGWVVTMGFVTAGLSIYVKHQIDNTLHPPTPEFAVTVRLMSLWSEDRKMLGATDVTTNVLPATTLAEKAGEQRRVAYSATLRVEEGHRKQRISFLKQHLASIRTGKSPDDAKSVQKSIDRLRPEGYIAHGIARVTKSADGWHWNTDDSPDNQPWAWFYDIYFENQRKTSREHPTSR